MKKTFRSAKFAAHLLIGLALLLSFGCGSSNETFNTGGQFINGNTNPTTPSTVNMSFSFNGAAAREIRQRLVGSLDLPSNTDAVVVTILNAATRETVAGPSTFERNGQATLDVEIADVPAGEVVVLVQALDQNDSVLVIGEGTGTVVDGVDVTLTIATLFSDIVVSPSPVYVAPGESVQVSVTATPVGGGNGTTVTNLSTFSAAADTVVATVSGTGQVTAPNNSAGDTTFTVDFNGLTATVPVANPQTLVVPNFDSILFFREDGSGATTPVAEITGNNTTLSQVSDVFVAGQELFVSDENGPITIFSADADGNVAPIRTIFGGNTGLAVPISLAVGGGEIFVLDPFQQKVSVFQSSDDGNVLPTRELVGANTEIMNPTSIWVEGNELFVADTQRILVFSSTASGNQPPTRILTGAQTNLGFVNDIYVRGNELFVANQDFGRILVFPLTADGDVAPSRTIGGTRTEIGAINGLAANEIGEIYLANTRSGEFSPFRDLRSFAPGASGNVAPNRVFANEGALSGQSGQFLAGLFIYQR